MIYKYKKKHDESCICGQSAVFYKEKNIGKLIHRYFCDLLVCVKQMVIGVCESNLEIVVSFSITTIINGLLVN